MKRALLIAVCLLACAPAFADPLFDSDEVFSITLHGPFSLMSRERDKSRRYDGQLDWEDRTFDIELEVRGNKRLDKRVCRYPPLRLDLKKDQIDDTLFDKQDDIKLVVQCKGSGRYADYLRAEYLVYRAFNLITPNSYRARWVDVTWVDTDGGRERTAPAFFVERKSRLAKRLGLKTSHVARISHTQLEPLQATLVGLFQYVIANSDYSVIAAPAGDECCHNAKLLAMQDGRYLPVIYDFDSSGVIDASYAVPAMGLGIRKVTDRAYRGFCLHNDQLQAARATFLEAEQPVLALFENDPLLSSKMRASTTRFLRRSFSVLRDDNRFDREIVRECRGGTGNN